jgi:hypothetical protein
VDGTIARATVEIGDLCSECFRLLQGAKTDVERDLKDTPALKGHLGHKWNVELLKTERIPDPVGYASAKLFYGLTCDCGGLPMYEGVLFSSSKLVTSS